MSTFLTQVSNFFRSFSVLLRNDSFENTGGGGGGGGGGLQPKKTERYRKFQIWDWFFSVFFGFFLVFFGFFRFFNFGQF